MKNVEKLSLPKLLEVLKEDALLNRREIDVLRRARDIERKREAAMEKAYDRFKDKKFEVRGQDADEVQDIVHDAMWEYAHEQGFQFDSGDGRFWEPSSC